MTDPFGRSRIQIPLDPRPTSSSSICFELSRPSSFGNFNPSATQRRLNAQVLHVSESAFDPSKIPLYTGTTEVTRKAMRIKLRKVLGADHILITSGTMFCSDQFRYRWPQPSSSCSQHQCSGVTSSVYCGIFARSAALFFTAMALQCSHIRDETPRRLDQPGRNLFKGCRVHPGFPG